MYTVYFVRALSGPLDHPPLCNSVHTQYLSVTACPTLAPPHFSLTPPRPVVMSWPWACKQKRVKKWANTSRHRRQGNPPIVDQQKWPARRTKSEPPPPHLHSPSTPLNLPPSTLPPLNLPPPILPPPHLHSPSTPPPLSLHSTSHLPSSLHPPTLLSPPILRLNSDSEGVAHGPCACLPRLLYLVLSHFHSIIDQEQR